MGERIRVLITVKTYPVPSVKYDEIVCTAGVREDGSFIRLYPIDYRNRPYWQWYKKYQWVSVEVEKNQNDPRPESFRPLGVIRPLGDSLDTNPAQSWKKRREFVFRHEVAPMCLLNKKKQAEVSLGLVKPLKVKDFTIEAVEKNWKPQQALQINQLKLFGPDKKPLEKIPYKFSYQFTCSAEGCKGHAMMIEDWEACELYRNMRNKFKDEVIACEKVKEKFLGVMCAPDRDTHFFVGTILQHGTWVILGTFWPKKEGM